MRRRIKLLLLFLLFSIFPIVIGFAVVNIEYFRFGPVNVQLSSTTEVFVDPPTVIDDTLQAGSNFTVNLNVSDVNDLFAWQVNMSWNSSILNVSRLTAGEFLLRTTSENKTASFQIGSVINVTDDAEGYTDMSESILGDVSGISGSGRLVSIEFLVIDYGWTDLNISVSGTLPTVLLDSAGGTITYVKIDGYFSNKILGDIDGDRDVDFDDLIILAQKYGINIGDPGYDSRCDLNHDGNVDHFDFIIFAGNHGKSI